jgi:hypothetical protein
MLNIVQQESLSIDVASWANEVMMEAVWLNAPSEYKGHAAVRAGMVYFFGDVSR